MALSRPMRCAPVLVLLLLGLGCRSQPQTQLVERELRWQENQIYALEDYLMEYQAKVRRLREENSSLAQALEECEAARGSSRPASTRRRQTTNSQPEELPALKFDLPEPPGRRQQTAPTEDQLPTPSREEPQVPDQRDGEDLETPPIPLPEMPPEDEVPLPTTWLGPPPLQVVVVDLPWIVTEADSQDPPLDQADSELLADSPVALAAHEEPPKPWISGGLDDEPDEPAEVLAIEPLPEYDGQESQIAAADNVDIPPAEDDILSAEDGPAMELLPLELTDTGLAGQVAWVLLHTELARGSDSGAQLLRLRVTPMAADDMPTQFDGSVSVMLRDPTVSGPEGRLARWDFAADAVLAARSSEGPDNALSLALPLDEPLPENRPVALWVRLSPADDAQEKILDHLTLRLDAPRRKSTPGDLEGGKWAVARPGEPALVDGPRPRITSAWRTAEAAPLPTTR